MVIDDRNDVIDDSTAAKRMKLCSIQRTPKKHQSATIAMMLLSTLLMKVMKQEAVGVLLSSCSLISFDEQTPSGPKPQL